jgi:hypothetical protein
MFRPDTEGDHMRFIITTRPADGKPKAVDAPIDDELFTAYMKYNEALHTAGVLVAAEGLLPGTPGAQVVASGGRRRVVDGPFAEAKEVVGGYWIIQARSKEEAVEWAKRCPGVDCRVEVRPIWEMEDFTPEVKEALKEYDKDLHPGT